MRYEDFSQQSDAHPQALLHTSDLRATGLPAGIIFGHGRVRCKDEDLITW